MRKVQLSSHYGPNSIFFPLRLRSSWDCYQLLPAPPAPSALPPALSSFLWPALPGPKAGVQEGKWNFNLSKLFCCRLNCRLPACPVWGAGRTVAVTAPRTSKSSPAGCPDTALFGLFGACLARRKPVTISRTPVFTPFSANARQRLRTMKRKATPEQIARGGRFTGYFLADD